MKVGMRILLVGGNHVAFNTTERDAAALMAKWKNKELPEFLSGADYTPGGSRWEWVVKTGEVAAMHTFEIPQGPAQAYPGISRSGLN